MTVSTGGRKRPRIALLAPALLTGGGVPSVARFLHAALTRSGGFSIDCISIAMSSSDESSVRLTRPGSWLRGVEVAERDWRGIPVRHVGAFLTDLEFQRYRPRRRLTRMLEAYDLVQVVAGIPAWALVARTVDRPVALQVATTAARERETRLALDTGPVGAYRALMSRYTRRLDRRALRSVDAVFVENREMEHIAVSSVGPDRVVFAPPGVDVEAFAPRTGDPPSDYILTVGRLGEPRKNLPLLLNAYAKVRAERPDAPRLVIAGKGALPAEHEARLRELGLGAAVSIRRDVAQAELLELYRDARFFVLSSNEEGLGMVILEAMASGLAVVSTDCGGPRTLVVPDETGVLTPVGDAEALAARILDLVDDPARCDALGRAARRRAEASFSLEAAGRRYIEVYRRLLSRRRANVGELMGSPCR